MWALSARQVVIATDSGHVLPARQETPYRVFGIDDEPIVTRGLARMLKRRGFQIEGCDRPAEAIEILRRRCHEFDLVLLDLNMPELSGLEVLPQIRAIDPQLPVVVLTGDNSAPSAVASLRGGAFNYMVKPIVDADAAALTLAKAAQFGQLGRRSQALERQVEAGAIVGSSAAMRSVHRLIARVADTDACVLIRGESGTGKELVAKRLHELSRRSHSPFVPLNCGAFPESMIDSELFGHERGAFTGAVRTRAGAFVEAHGGSLLLDEIGDVPMSVQLRLLRVLQEREVRPVGGTGVRQVDVRVLAATNADLEFAVEQGTFRQDLYYRLNVVTIVLPPLRDRTEDIPNLAAHFLNKHKGASKAAKRIAPAALEKLLAHSWPGNIRELENAIWRASTLAGDGDIDLPHLPDAIRGLLPGPGQAAPPSPADGDELSWTDALSFCEARNHAKTTFELAYVDRLLRLTENNISEAARRAGLDRSNFRRVLTRLGLRESK